MDFPHRRTPIHTAILPLAVSNPEEEALLKDAEYQKRIAEALRQGICNYLESEKNAPENPEGTIYEGDDEISSENLSYKIPWYSTENVL